MSNNQLIEKLAAAVGIDGKPSLSDRKNIALKVAAQMLTAAADKQGELLNKISSMQDTISKYESEKLSVEKQDLIDEVVSTMFESGIIDKKAMIEKRRELSKLDVESVSIVKEAMTSMQIKVGDDKLNELTFLYGNNNIREKVSFATTVAEYGKN